MSLKFIALSGTTGVTENCYLYETEKDMLMVDCGVGFPEQEMFGVDLVIPDFSYIKKNAKKLRGIIISHGHEDHMGALPFLFKDVRAPIYCTKLVAGFINDKFKDHSLKNVQVNVFDPEKDVLNIGEFKVTPFRVTHSVPDSVGYAIDSHQGRSFHIAEHKFDQSPVVGHTIDEHKIKDLAKNGALFLASDCLGSNKLGFTKSEKVIESKIDELVSKSSGTVFFTTISSNISRMQQAINVAKKNGRKIAFVGRSSEAKAKIARGVGYLEYSSDMVVPMKILGRQPKEKRMYIISGSYGQPGSALYKVALSDHRFIKIESNDTVIFSSDPAPPGAKESVDFLVDRLTELNTNVSYYDTQVDMHVSGHGSREDILKMFNLVKPKYYIPVGGTVRFMRAYRDLVVSGGGSSSSVFELTPGEVVEFNKGNGQRSGKIKSKEILVDGLGIGDVGNVVLRDRQILANEGVAIAMIQIDGEKAKLASDPEIFSRGFVFEKAKKGLLVSAGRQLGKKISEKERVDTRTTRFIAIDFLEKFFYKEMGRRPMILPVIVKV